MSELTISGIMGVLSGIVATFCWWFGSQVLNKMILPWYRTQRYQGVLIDGEWNGYYTDMSSPDSPHSCCIHLNQEATLISGEIIETDGPDKGKRYSISGEFRNSILTLIYQESNLSRIDRGTIALYLKENGTAFEGFTVYYSDSENSMKQRSYRWTRSM
jgi:hypothetical protein